MAYTGNVSYHNHGGIDEIFDEKGSKILAMRRIQWGKEGFEPDPSKAKLELRKWIVTEEGEMANKGFAFLTEEGPHNLAEMLVRHNYGKTKNILKSLSKREDFKTAIETINDGEACSSDPNGEYFDMREMLLGIEDVDDE